MCKDEGDIQGQRIDVSTQRKETPLDLLPTVSSLNPGQFFFFFALVSRTSQRAYPETLKN